MRPARAALLAAAVAGLGPGTGAAIDAAQLYERHCAACHGLDRLGGSGPALVPENFERLPPQQARRVIREGRLATQMPGFGALLSESELEALVAYLYTPVTPRPAWGTEQIAGSRIVHRHAPPALARPRHAADPLNLFVVVEAHDHHVTILDGDRLEPIARFPSRRALHGGPKFTAAGRYVYFASRDGWVSKYDLWTLEMVVEARAGINTRNLAVSSDGRYVAVANYLPHTIAILDAELRPVQVIPVTDATGVKSSRVSAVYDASPRRSFVAALKDVPELWEISYDSAHAAKPIGTAANPAAPSANPLLHLHRTLLDEVLDDFFFTPDFAQLVGTSREATQAQVIDLEARRRIARLELPGLPHLGSGITWTRAGRTVLATPNLRQGLLTVVDVATWTIVAQIPTLGPGFFLRSHEASRYAFLDAMLSREHRDTLQVLDKQTLQIVALLRPEPGKTLAHVEFDRHGRHALASLWEDAGALIVYEASTLAEVKRLPMRRPVGKYNVFNKITRSEGTSR